MCLCVQVEVRNPKPHVKKVVETRYTTIRYPVFITQVIKPLLTQVETKVRPMFFTKTINRYTTVRFTVTGIGQVTVTTVKYEKEYITRCNKKGYGGGHHRREAVEEDSIESDLPDVPVYRTKEPAGLVPRPPPGLPWDTPRYPLRAGTDISPSVVVESQETVPPVIQNAFRGSSPFRPNNSAWPRTRLRSSPVRIGRSAELEEDLIGSQELPESETSQPHPPLYSSSSSVVG